MLRLLTILLCIYFIFPSVSFGDDKADKAFFEDTLLEAKQGETDAQYNLGVMYAKGQGVEQDYKQGVNWWTKAAEQGHARAQNNLGLMYAKGQGVQKDYKQVVNWWTKAAEQGHTAAQYNLGVMYAKGQGVQQDYKQVINWWTKAAEQGHTDAQYNLGVMYAKGQGVQQDYKQVINWLTKAAEQGHTDAQYYLGNMFAMGQVVQQNFKFAYAWLSLAATQGHESAVKNRDIVAKKLTSQQLAEAQMRASQIQNTWTEYVTGMKFVWVPKGCFQMGSNSGGRTERPVHEVCVDGFWMGKFEVTNQQYRRFKSNHYSKSYNQWVNMNGDDQPVVEVSWEKAQAFVQWLNRKTGQEFALPTEAQWEYAARAGTRTMRYWGDGESDACQYANVNDNTAKLEFAFSWSHFSCNDGYAATAPVGRFQPNAYGLYDMLGNVWEWCEDVFDKNAYFRYDCNNPVVTSGGSAHVYRGGSWSNSPEDVRAAYRGWAFADHRGDCLGFRLSLPQIRQ
ncbi:MAG: SUMF1/EgtB/PvdO family nonheme iron enzyme [Desulfotignum sp.]|nr:SUMF1/EgtB/PvdO family nonheme iron enzyme [Desulfotignum sp.]